jgi:hypothetical protein
MPPALEEGNHAASTLHRICRCRHHCRILLLPSLPDPALDPSLPGAMPAATGSTRPSPR